MKILVYGAGALGSLMAGKLLAGGHEVKLLARGKRLENLRQHGLILEHWITGEVTTPLVELVEELKPEDSYDLVITVMGRQQVLEILPILARNQTVPTFLFLGNNAGGPDEIINAIGKQRALMGFFAAAGTIEGPAVKYIEGADAGPARVTIGEPDGTISSRLDCVAKALEQSELEVEKSENIDAWLKTHAAFIVPLACGLYIVSGDNVRLAETPDAVILVMRGVREAFRTLHRAGIPVTPFKLRMYEWIPEPLLIPLASKMLKDPYVKYAFSHADIVRPEISRLADEIAGMAQQVSLPTPNLDRLFASIETGSEVIPTGSAELQPAWKELLPWIVIPLFLLLLRMRARRK